MEKQVKIKLASNYLVISKKTDLLLTLLIISLWIIGKLLL